MILSAIAAMTEDRVIGVKNQLPWQIPEDLKFFKETTLNKIIIMGRKTFESIGRPLPKRENIIITRQKDYRVEGANVFSSIDEALKYADGKVGKNDEVFIVGGAQIYEEALQQTKRFYLTIIHKKYDGDAFFPKLNFEKDFRVVSKRESSQETPEPLRYTFLTFDRI